MIFPERYNFEPSLIPPWIFSASTFYYATFDCAPHQAKRLSSHKPPAAWRREPDAAYIYGAILS
jgi:hypothetical protein